MEATRCWFNKFKSKDKMKSPKSKESTAAVKEGSRPPINEEAPSNVTKQKAAAAKQYIENHYKKQMKSLQERKERYVFFFHRSCTDVLLPCNVVILITNHTVISKNILCIRTYIYLLFLLVVTNQVVCSLELNASLTDLRPFLYCLQYTVICPCK